MSFGKKSTPAAAPTATFTPAASTAPTSTDTAAAEKARIQENRATNNSASSLLADEDEATRRARQSSTY